MSLLSYIRAHNAPEQTQSMAPALATLDLLTPGAAREHWGHRFDLTTWVPRDRLKQLDAQAWAWTVWEAFESSPALDEVRLVEPEQTEGNAQTWSGSLRVESTPPMGLEDLSHVLRRLAWHQPVFASDVLARPVLLRQDRELWARRWGGVLWWAQCQALRLELGLPESDNPTPLIRSRL